MKKNDQEEENRTKKILKERTKKKINKRGDKIRKKKNRN